MNCNYFFFYIAHIYTIHIFSKIKYFIGGTLGLFTGMSLLSMIELLFWFSKAIIKGALMFRPINSIRKTSVRRIKQKYEPRIKT